MTMPALRAVQLLASSLQSLKLAEWLVDRLARPESRNESDALALRRIGLRLASAELKVLEGLSWGNTAMIADARREISYVHEVIKRILREYNATARLAAAELEEATP